jgi:hypothetical protein
MSEEDGKSSEDRCVKCGLDSITHLDDTGTLCKYCWNLWVRQDIQKVDLTYLDRVMPI